MPSRPNAPAKELRLLVVVLTVVGTLALLLTSVSQLQGQVSEKECLDFSTGRMGPCDASEETNDPAAVQPSIPKDLAEYIEKTKSITPDQQAKIEEVMESRFTEVRKSKTQLILGILDTSINRVHALLELNWDDSDLASLERLQIAFPDYSATLKSDPSGQAYKTLRSRINRDLKQLQEIATRRQRQDTKSVPIENIVTRIDAVVTQAGTVIRELDADSVAVPPVAREGYENAKTAVTEAKRNCSMRRPQGCVVLWDALIAIQSIQEPLCDVASTRVEFCRG